MRIFTLICHATVTLALLSGTPPAGRANPGGGSHPAGHAYGWCKNHGGCSSSTNVHIGAPITSGHPAQAVQSTPMSTLTPAIPTYKVPPMPVQMVPKPRPVIAPPKLPRLVPKLKQGYIDHPNFTGRRDPNTGYPVPTLPVQKVPLPKPIVAPPVP